MKKFLTFILQDLYCIIISSKFDDFIFNIFFSYAPINIFKFFESSYSGYLRRYIPKKNDVVIEAGAYKGNFTILLSRLVGKNGKIISMEPNSLIFKILERRIKKLGLKNVVLLNKGLWNKNKYIEFYEGKQSDKDFGVLFEKNIHNKKTKYRIECITIDVIVKKYKLNRVNSIIMDIEGAEIEAIKGAFQTLKKFQVNLAVASYHIRDGNKTYKELEKIFRELNYYTETSNYTHLTTYASKYKFK